MQSQPRSRTRRPNMFLAAIMFLAVCILLTAAACGGAVQEATETPSETETETETPSSLPATSEAAAETFDTTPTAIPAPTATTLPEPTTVPTAIPPTPDRPLSPLDQTLASNLEAAALADANCSVGTDPLPSPTELTPKWQAGMVRDLQITTIKPVAGSNGQEISGTTPAQVRVVADTETGWDFEWITGTTTLDEADLATLLADIPAQLVDTVTTRLNEINELSAYSITYELDRDGFLVGPTNQNEILDKIGTVYASLSGLFTDLGLNSQAVTFEQLAQNLPTEVIIDDLMQLPLAYHAADGWFLYPGDPVFQEISVPSPFDGQLLPATISTRLDVDRTPNGCALLTTSVNFDADELGSAILAALEALNPDAPAPTQAEIEEFAALALEIGSATTVAFDVEAGIPRAVIIGTFVSGTEPASGTESQTETRVIVDITEG